LVSPALPRVSLRAEKKPRVPSLPFSASLSQPRAPATPTSYHIPVPPILPEHETAAGALPSGVSSPASAAESIQQMFDTIAPTYDRANHLLSAGLDRLWWSRAARTLRPILRRPEAVVLDLCCGTGDMTLTLDKHRPQPPNRVPQLSPLRTGFEPPSPTAKAEPAPVPILAADFSHAMLALGVRKFAGKNILPIEADALNLPLATNSVDLVTAAFGFRNLANYEAGLAELFRVLGPGGQIAILECNQPDGLVGFLYSFYFHRLLPTLGGLISGTPRAYAYLPDSVQRFPRPPRMKQLIAAAGFANPTWTSYTFGTVGLYHASKP
jgi:demethylmenaquinone methyltransferase / 2-methoxy-6-polyprenyl-1,4-benzoquinol methylase